MKMKFPISQAELQMRQDIQNYIHEFLDNMDVPSVGVANLVEDIVGTVKGCYDKDPPSSSLIDGERVLNLLEYHEDLSEHCLGTAEEEGNGGMKQFFLGELQAVRRFKVLVSQMLSKGK